MPLLLMFRFRVIDPIKKRWRTTRYLAELHVIQERFQEYQIERLEEIRYRGPGYAWRWFDPHRDPPKRVQAVKVKPRWRVVGVAR